LKHVVFALTFAVVLAGLVYAEQNVAAETTVGVSVRDVKKETKEALEATKVFTARQKEAFHEKMEAELKEMQTRINHLKEKANAPSAEVRAEVHKQIDELEKKKVEAGKNLQELKSASAAAWGNLKAKFLAMMKDLEESYKRALSRLQ